MHQWTILLVLVAVPLAELKNENPETKDYSRAPLCELCKCAAGQADCRSKTIATLPDITVKNITSINFEKNNLTRITKFPPLINLTYLSFDHNHISKIDALAFYNLSSLIELDLGHNELNSLSLQPNTFKGPYHEDDGHEYLNIRILKLTGNLIHSINSDAFQNLIYLEEIYLDSNPITQIDHSTLVAIGNLYHLKILNLASTGISIIPPGMLYTPQVLEVLNISSNAFREIPKQLSDTQTLRELVFNDNPVISIKSFPSIKSLKTLHINWMTRLKEIGDYAFSNLTNLEQLYCTSNAFLVNITDKAFQLAITPESPHITYLPLKKLYLNDNRLSYINEELFARWDLLEELNLDANPWSCDCNNQWFLAHLIRKMNQSHQHLENLICAVPEQMKNQRMADLVRNNAHLRCLDVYGNHPEKDEKVLIFMLVATLFSVPIALIIVGYIRRPRPLSSYYPKAVYKKAVSEESVATY